MGKSTFTVAGTFDSAALANTATVSTPTALAQFGGDKYPRDGVIGVSVGQSNLRLTAVTAGNLRSELDAAGTGTFTNAQVVEWESLR